MSDLEKHVTQIHLKNMSEKKNKPPKIMYSKIPFHIKFQKHKNHPIYAHIHM